MTRAILLTLTLAIATACAPGQGDQLRAQTDMLLRQNNIDVDLNELTTSEVTSINVALSDGDASRTEKRMSVEAILRNKERRRTDEPALVIGSLPPV
ncbi:hypothetical protein [Ovoidimarina sediminis]|uniref:hypothetical protein n=1 Tax=Ovoidimarina sediminis TaxID=3079856 RepID=UPI00290FCD04|nr:hypothetical protein [Rhodophyticola sp. MJ-SS7]MDU8942379.1 hypothetical protein [Rhodophyticola sp. MJ-SS7]